MTTCEGGRHVLTATLRVTGRDDDAGMYTLTGRCANCGGRATLVIGVNDFTWDASAGTERVVLVGSTGVRSADYVLAVKAVRPYVYGLREAKDVVDALRSRGRFVVREGLTDGEAARLQAELTELGFSVIVEPDA